MENEIAPSFDALVSHRQHLQRFCAGHFESLSAFYDQPCFRVTLSDPPLKGTIRHLSSSATCIESLFDCPAVFRPSGSLDPIALAQAFSENALKRPQNKWISDGSAPIYCRCRTLPLIVRHLPRYDIRLNEHLKRIFHQLDDQSGRLAIGEASGPKQRDWYPPNAFHTYWTLRLLKDIEEAFPENFKTLKKKFASKRFNIDRVRAEMLMWARQTAGYQIGLHALPSSLLDTDQLAWSLAALISFEDNFPAQLAEQDFLRQALACIFQQQTDAGTWRTGAPLFHYARSGNAYCYVFETFGLLLRSVLTHKSSGPFLRAALYPYVDKLVKLWQYARSTEIPLNTNGLGWNSSHHPNRHLPESWTTASVYAFAQALRRLVGLWTRERAAAKRGVGISAPARDDAISMLQTRGDTWGQNGRSVATQLLIRFVNPSRCFAGGDKLEPDSQPIREVQARAAILFGPPGTSKTTLSRSVASAIGWDYVEIHASHFVADGLPNVQKTADAIFEQLMQLDRTVILFDEIDELVRAREKEPDAFGRFLTTSMLPKLAELWNRRKVFYFIATNQIRYFDPAVMRAQRFDSLIHVPPPSFDRKIGEIVTRLGKNGIRVQIHVTAADVEAAVKSAAVKSAAVKDAADGEGSRRDETIGASANLAKLLLMRWDQLDELVAIIRARANGKVSVRLDKKDLAICLGHLRDPALKRRSGYRDYDASSEFGQHDFGKVSLWRVNGALPSGCGLQLLDGCDGGRYISEVELNGRELTGKWRISKAGEITF